MDNTPFVKRFKRISFIESIKVFSLYVKLSVSLCVEVNECGQIIFLVLFQVYFKITSPV